MPAIEPKNPSSGLPHTHDDGAGPAPLSQTPLKGFGRCSKCECGAFEGSGDICTNCKHSYESHW
jgi:hypothetical protein